VRVIDISRLPAPEAVQALDFEAILAALKSDFTARWPEFTAALESDPVIKLLEVAAYRELLIRQRINDAYKASTLAFAAGADLDHVGAFHGIARKKGEPDQDFRSRIQGAYWRLSSTGPAAAFVAHALEASPEAHDAQAWSDGAGRAACAVLARVEVERSHLEPDARIVADALTRYAFASAPRLPSNRVYTLAESLLEESFRVVRERLLSPDVLPLGMELSVRPAEIVPYSIGASLVLLPGYDELPVLEEADARLHDYLASITKLGRDVTRAGLHAALFVPGVMNVVLMSPGSDVRCSPGQLAVPTSIGLTNDYVRDE